MNEFWNKVVCLNCIWDWSRGLGTALVASFFLLVLPIKSLANLVLPTSYSSNRGGMTTMMIYSFRQGIVQKEKEGVCLDPGIFFSSPT